MASTDVFRVVFVDYMPSLIDEGVLYVSMLNHTAIHLCACGCGEKVVTPIAPNRWFLTYDGETISLNPSIGNWSFVCKSHYFIQNNRVLWCEKFRGRKRHRQNNLIKNVSLKHADIKTPAKDRLRAIMAKDAEGRKFNRIPGYDREVNGKIVHVRPHVRSNRSDSKGEQKK
jgi:hypothetical protein